MGNSFHPHYLVTSPIDMEWGLAVNSVGKQVINPGDPYPPSNHPSRYLFSMERGRVLAEYQLVYLTEGEGRFVSASIPKEEHVSRGTMFLLFPGERHAYCPLPETGWTEYWIGFNGPLVDERIRHAFFSKEKPVLNVGIHDEMVDLYERAIKIATSQESGYQTMLGSIAFHLLGMAYFFDRNAGYRENEMDILISRAKIIIAEEFRTIIPEDLAARLNMGYSNFRKLFKDYTGLSPAKYISVIKFNNIKEKLTNTNIPVKEIAFQMGFESYDYFFTAFRKHTGMTPSEFRSFTQGLRGSR